MDPPRARNPTRKPGPVNFPAPARRRRFSSSSFSSMSSCSSSSIVFPGDSPLNSPATPLRLLGVPFSWEQLPGKPKEPHNVNLLRNSNEPIDLLPLPPHRSLYFPTAGKHRYPSSRKKNSIDSTVKDPFEAALVECSKEDEDDDEDDDNDDVGRNSRRFGRKINGGSSKALSKSNVGERFGLVNLYGSCRRTCAVSESIVYIPRSSEASSYHRLLLHRRR